MNEPTEVKLTAYGGNRISVLDTCQLKCKYKNEANNLEFYVVNATAPTALSLKTCQDILLIKVIMMVNKQDENTNCDQLLEEFSDVFKGKGCLSHEYHIQLKPGVKPVVHAARKIPVSWIDKVKRELERMEKLNIIQRVDEPTEWMNSMAVVPKPNGEVRICLDPRDLNFVVKRKHYQMPTPDKTTSQFSGAKYFTVVDATAGYWNVPLSKESSILTTFQTSFGRFCYLRMPFGIFSAQEVLQKRMDRVFGELPGVHVIVDDTLVSGSMREEHDERLRANLTAARQNGVKFNPKKIQKCSSEFNFFGELITKNGLKPHPSKVALVRNMTSP
jgi:hypothetical protein